MELQSFANDLFGSEDNQIEYTEVPSKFELTEMYIAVENSYIENETMFALLDVSVNMGVLSSESDGEGWLDKEEPAPEGFFAKIGHFIMKIIKGVLKFFRGILRWIKGLFGGKSKSELSYEEALKEVRSKTVSLTKDEVVEVLEHLDDIKVVNKNDSSEDLVVGTIIGEKDVDNAYNLLYNIFKRRLLPDFTKVSDSRNFNKDFYGKFVNLLIPNSSSFKDCLITLYDDTISLDAGFDESRIKHSREITLYDGIGAVFLDPSVDSIFSYIEKRVQIDDENKSFDAVQFFNTVQDLKGNIRTVKSYFPLGIETTTRSLTETFINQHNVENEIDHGNKYTKIDNILKWFWMDVVDGICYELDYTDNKTNGSIKDYILNSVDVVNKRMKYINDNMEKYLDNLQGDGLTKTTVNNIIASFNRLLKAYNVVGRLIVEHARYIDHINGYKEVLKKEIVKKINDIIERKNVTER